MPSLGGLLKKRRTRDSHGNSKEEPNTNSNSSPAAETQTSPVAAESPANPSNSANPQSSANNPHSSSAVQSSDPSANSMQHTAAQNQQATQSHSGHQQNSSAASIQNIINAPHQDGSQGAAGNNGQQKHQPQIIRSDARTDARTTKGKYTLDDFTLQRTLGTGSFGRVHLVQSKHNHRFYAIKVLKKAQVVKMKQIEHTNDERRMLNRVRHPFLITLWGTWQDSRNLYMVMDFVEGGELFSLLRKSQVSVLNQLSVCVCGTDDVLNCSVSPTPSPSSTPPKSPWP